MKNVVKRILEVAGENFDDPKCRVTNPHITARESIELANYIKELQDDLEFLLEQHLLNDTHQDFNKIILLKEKYREKKAN